MSGSGPGAGWWRTSDGKWFPPEQHPAVRLATDDDREAASAVLREGLAKGQLTVDEHSSRVSAVLEARTLGEIATLTGDLGSSPVPDRSHVRKLLMMVAAALLVAGLVTTIVLESGSATAVGSHATSGTQAAATSPTCTTDSGSTLLSCTGNGDGQRVATPRFTVAGSGTMFYSESSNCVSGAMLLEIFQTGVSSIPEPSLFGCNSLTYHLTKGTYYVVVTATGDWKLAVSGG